jgi:hypothetical protein
MDDMTPTGGGIAAAIVSTVSAVVGVGAGAVRRASKAFDLLEARVARLEERLGLVEIRHVRGGDTEDEFRALADKLQAMVQTKLDSDDFFQQLQKDQERWEKLSRSLGQIEGMLGVLHEKLRASRR